MTNETRLLLVDDHEVFRTGLATIVESVPGFRVVAEASSVREGLRLIQECAFELLIVDVSLPGTSGLALVREMRRLKRPEPILVLTMHDSAPVAVEAFAAGATSFALKSDSRQLLLEAITRTARGRQHISPSSQAVVESLLRRNGSGNSGLGALAPLSVREREIFDLFARGFDNAAVARELCISPRTVETHRGHIFVKLNLHSMAELVRFAFQHQLASHHAMPAVDEVAVKRTAG